MTAKRGPSWSSWKGMSSPAGFIPPPCCEHVPYRLLSVKAQVPPTPPRLDRKKPPPPRARSPEPPPKTYVVTLPF